MPNPRQIGPFPTAMKIIRNRIEMATDAPIQLVDVTDPTEATQNTTWSTTVIAPVPKMMAQLSGGQAQRAKPYPKFTRVLPH